MTYLTYLPNPIFLTCKDPFMMPTPWVFIPQATLIAFISQTPDEHLFSICVTLPWDTIFCLYLLPSTLWVPESREQFLLISLPYFFLKNKAQLRGRTLSPPGIYHLSQEQCSDNPFPGWTIFMKKINRGENTPLIWGQCGHSLSRALEVIYKADVIINGHPNTMTTMVSSLPYIPLLNSIRELA